MAEVVHVGCADLPHGVGWSRYFDKLDFVETPGLQRGPIRPSVLAKWRAAAPGPGAFAVVAPAPVTHPTPKQGWGAAGWPLTADERRLAGHLADTEPVHRGIAALAEGAAALDAGVVVFNTPPSFSPSAGNRDRLRRFFGELAPAERFGAAARVWRPEGLWEVPAALAMCTELDLILGADPLLRDPTRDPVDYFGTLDTPRVYFRVSGIGTGRRTLRSSQLEEIGELVEAYEQAWILFATVDPMADAVRLRRMIGAPAGVGQRGQDAEE